MREDADELALPAVGPAKLVEQASFGGDVVVDAEHAVDPSVRPGERQDNPVTVIDLTARDRKGEVVGLTLARLDRLAQAGLERVPDERGPNLPARLADKRGGRDPAEGAHHLAERGVDVEDAPRVVAEHEAHREILDGVAEELLHLAQPRGEVGVGWRRRALRRALGVRDGSRAEVSDAIEGLEGRGLRVGGVAVERRQHAHDPAVGRAKRNRVQRPHLGAEQGLAIRAARERGVRFDLVEEDVASASHHVAAAQSRAQVRDVFEEGTREAALGAEPQSTAWAVQGLQAAAVRPGDRQGLGQSGVEESRQLSVAQELYGQAVQAREGGRLGALPLFTGPAAVPAPGIVHVAHSTAPPMDMQSRSFGKTKGRENERGLSHGNSSVYCTWARPPGALRAPAGRKQGPLRESIRKGQDSALRARGSTGGAFEGLRIAEVEAVRLAGTSDDDAPTGVFVRPSANLWDAQDVARYLKVSRSWVRPLGAPQAPNRCYKVARTTSRRGRSGFARPSPSRKVSGTLSGFLCCCRGERI